jgi:hypothetical protein
MLVRTPGHTAGSQISLGKGAVRFKKLDSKKVDLLRTLLREVLAKGTTC